MARPDEPNILKSTQTGVSYSIYPSIILPLPFPYIKKVIL